MPPSTTKTKRHVSPRIISKDFRHVCKHQMRGRGREGVNPFAGKPNRPFLMLIGNFVRNSPSDQLFFLSPSSSLALKAQACTFHYRPKEGPDEVSASGFMGVLLYPVLRC